MVCQKEFEVIQHTTMNFIEIFLTETTMRSSHYHDDLEIGVVLEGTVELFLEQHPLTLFPGDIYIINRYQLHSFSSADGKNKILVFQIPSTFHNRIYYELSFFRFNNTITAQEPCHQSVYDLLLSCAALYFSGKPHIELKCAGLLFDALYKILSSSDYTITTERESAAAKNNSLRLSRIIHYIGEHFTEPVSLKDIAELENITPCHASHFIKQYLGISFQQYLNQIRFEHALQLMKTSELNILDICMECGFSNSKYLNQMFVKNFGCSALEYRNMKEKPNLRSNPLPTGTVQKRYTFEQGKAILDSFLYDKK